MDSGLARSARARERQLYSVFRFTEYRLTPDPNHRKMIRIPSHQKGRLAIATNAGRDAVDAEVPITNGTEAYAGKAGVFSAEPVCSCASCAGQHGAPAAATIGPSGDCETRRTFSEQTKILTVSFGEDQAMSDILQLSEFRERKRLAEFTQTMFLARVTGARVSPATTSTDNDPCNPYVTSPQCDGEYSAEGANIRSGRVLHQDAPVRPPESYESSRE